LYPLCCTHLFSEWVQWVQMQVIAALQGLLCTHSESSDRVFEEFGGLQSLPEGPHGTVRQASTASITQRHPGGRGGSVGPARAILRTAPRTGLGLALSDRLTRGVLVTVPPPTGSRRLLDFFRFFQIFFQIFLSRERSIIRPISTSILGVRNWEAAKLPATSAPRSRRAGTLKGGLRPCRALHAGNSHTESSRALQTLETGPEMGKEAIVSHLIYAQRKCLRRRPSRAQTRCSQAAAHLNTKDSA
jgi:hypothetical protein